MFDKLKKKSIEIICPACKGGQTEPSLAFSTYCRNCGEHLKIVKGIARLNSGPQLSGISTIRVVSESVPLFVDKEEETDKQNGHKNGKAETWVKSKTRPETRKPEKKKKRKKSREQPAGEKPQTETSASPEKEVRMDREPPASVAEVFGLTRDKEEPDSPPIAPEEDYKPKEHSISLGNESASYEELSEGSMAAMIGDLVEQEEKREKAKANRDTLSVKPVVEKTVAPPPEPRQDIEKDDPPEPGILAEPEKPIVTKKEISKNQIKVRCFRCNHRQLESKHAESTQCGRCNTYISLADYHIRQPTDRVIRTRGNVTVHRKGSLIGDELACRNLLAMGTISTKIDCSGEARFKYSASVNGNLHCESLIVEKGTIVEFSEGVYTESVKIYGTLRGDVTCAGLVEVTRTGILDGDVIARDIDLQDGGTLTGEMAVDPDLKVKLPEVKGYDPSIID